MERIKTWQTLLNTAPGLQTLKTLNRLSVNARNAGKKKKYSRMNSTDRKHAAVAASPLTLSSVRCLERRHPANLPRSRLVNTFGGYLNIFNFYRHARKELRQVVGCCF
jgi:hypothetical protein